MKYFSLAPFAAVVLMVSPLAQAAVRITQDARSLLIQTSTYTLRLDKERGYSVTGLQVEKGPEIAFAEGGLVIAEEGENAAYLRNSWFAVPKEHAQSAAKVACRIVEQSDAAAKIQLQYETPAGGVELLLNFTDASPRVQANCIVRYGKPLINAWFTLSANNLSSGASEGIFYPQGQRIGGVGNTGFCRPTPAFEFAFNPKRNLGFGLGGDDARSAAYLEYLMRGKKEGWGGDYTRVSVFSRPVRWSKAPGKLRFDFFLLVGSNAEAAGAAANIRPSKPLAIEQVSPRKLIHRMNEAAVTDVVVQNHADAPATAELVSEIVGGIDESTTADRRTIALAPGQRLPVEVAWNSGQREYGLTFRTRLLVDGKEVDVAEEYVAATDFAPKVGQVTILNPGHASQEGSEATYAQMARDNYFGILEYYCWAPDSVLDLTPDQEQWRPHTESQGAYEAKLTKKFLQELSRQTNQRGVHLYAMETGLMSLPNIYKHPELAQYTAEGQPYIYNGKLYDDRRYAVGPANIYDPKRVEQWGREMADSIDMFGWKGCRWDWAFVPGVPSDPLGLDAGHAAAQGMSNSQTWYDFTGKPGDQLFPNPDKTGADLLRIWRQAVKERHPGFVYGTNFNGDPETQKKMPLYFKEACTDALILFEYLLNTTKEADNTWAKWADHLVAATQTVRAYGGQPCVGYMRGYLPGGTALRMTQYLMFAAGTHWAGGAGPRHSLDDTWERFRFALRFSEYYYDPGFVRLPDRRRDEVSVVASERVFWKPFVYERPTPRGREVTVHLLNLPQSDFIVMHHEQPAVKKDLVIRLKPRPGEKFVRASGLFPEPMPRAEALPAVGGEQQVEVRVPELKTAAIIVLELSK